MRAPNAEIHAKALFNHLVSKEARVLVNIFP